MLLYINLIDDCVAGFSSRLEYSIRWNKDGERLDARGIKLDTLGRVQIDTLNLLSIRSARVTDSATYDCWYGFPRTKKGIFIVEGAY